MYDKLIETVSNNLEPLYRYYEIKRKKLSLEQLHLYDTYVSIVNESTKEYTFEEAKEKVKKALSVLGEKYISDLDSRDALEEEYCTDFYEAWHRDEYSEKHFTASIEKLSLTLPQRIIAAE